MPLVDPVTTSSTPDETPHQPIQPLSTPASRAAEHGLPILYSALMFYGFRALVADPVPTMWRTLPLVAILQAAYAVIRLPPAGSSRPARKHRPGEKKKEGGGPNLFVAVPLALLLSLSITPFFHIAMILFGAPFLTHVQHTMLCAAHLSVLTLFPLFYVHGVDPAAWLAVAGFRAPFDETFGGLVGGVVGAWLGAVPIPLDWDREWQKWPVTILCGIYCGYTLGKIVGATVAFGKRF